MNAVSNFPLFRMPLLCVLLACLVTVSVEAEVRNSVNYTVSAEIVDSAGLTATSTNYTELGSLGGILDTDIVVLTANEVASVSSSSAGPINIITATLNGDVTNDGGAEIVERGFIYALTSTDSTPTFAEAAEADGVGIIQLSEAGTTGSFAANITEDRTPHQADSIANLNAGQTRTARLARGGRSIVDFVDTANTNDAKR